MGFSEWKQVKLADICSKIGSGSTPKGGANVYCTSGITFIRSQNVLDFNFSDNGVVYINEDQGSKLKSVTVEEGDVLINITGDSVARVCIVPQEILPARVNQHVSIIRGKKEYVLNNYILYYLQFIKRDLLQMASSGATRNALTKLMLENINIVLPSMDEQKIITDILSSIDSKIQINNKINKSLQLISQLLFKHWFEYFEYPSNEGLPYKSSGGEMVDSELGMIPKGWTIKQLRDIKEMGTLVMGQSPSGSSYNNEKFGVPLVNGAADIKDGNLVPNKYTTEPKKITQVNDLIFCIRATIGLLTISDGEYCLGRGVAAITNINDNYYEYIYQVIDNSFEKFKKTAGGSVYINLSKDDFNNMKLIVPSENTLKLYHKVCAPILKLITSNKRQIAELSNLRDTLLPKLMSGEIDLSNLEINE